MNLWVCLCFCGFIEILGWYMLEFVFLYVLYFNVGWILILFILECFFGSKLFKYFFEGNLMLCVGLLNELKWGICLFGLVFKMGMYGFGW